MRSLSARDQDALLSIAAERAQARKDAHDKAEAERRKTSRRGS